MPEPQLRLRRPHSELLYAHVKNAAALAALREKGGLKAKAAALEKPETVAPREISWKPMGGSRAEELDALRRHHEWLEQARKRVKPS